MSCHLTTEAKIKSLEIEVEQADTYTADLYLLLVDINSFLMSVIDNKVPCLTPSLAEQRLDILIDRVKEKINMRHNFRMVMQQLKFAEE